jgi:hypothetical protein
MLNAMLRARFATALGLTVSACGVLACGGEAGVELNRRNGNVPSGVGGDAGVADAGAPRPPPSFIPEPPEPPPFEEPGCPPVEMRPPTIECDPLGAVSGCAVGESCFPFVDYPSGPCDVERFGTFCVLAGSGTQGESCAREPCAADHLCVSTGRGTQCARLCSLQAGAPDVCAPGLLCLPIDIEGFGGCL